MKISLFRKTMIFTIILLFIGLALNSSIGHVTLKSMNSSSNYGELKVYFIDVGQGDSTLIQTPENNFILIDTGERTYANTVIDFLNDLSVYTLKAFVGTHPHADHIGGAEEIFNAFDVQSAYDPGYDQNTATYQRFLNAVQNEGCPLYTDDDLDPGDYIDFGSSVTCQILNINKDASNTNDASIVLRLDYGSVSFLFTGDVNGDMGDFVELYMVDYWNVDVDILKVSHHGSRHASVDYFLDEATPDVSIISVGEGNMYGHPHPESLYRLQNHHSQIFRTDYNGDITIETDGFSWGITYEKPKDEPMKPVVTGTTYGMTNIEYMYTAAATDPNDDQLYYLWDWSDGNFSEWMGPYNSGDTVYAYHIWAQQGTYVIKVKAKDTDGYESEWGMLNVVMPRTKISFKSIFDFLDEQNILFQLLSRFLNI